MMSEGDAGTVTPKQSDLLEQAYQRNNEVIEIVNNLLDISEIEEGRFPYEFTEGDLTEVLQAVVKTGNNDGQRKQVTIALNLPKRALPPVEMDKQKLRMALQNIIDNAVKYSTEKSAITVTAGMKNNRYFITIADHGIGIPKEEQAKIFLKFFRGKNAKEKETTGSGLGLYIVKNVVQKHRGQIWFESVLNEGTTFFLSFPVARKYLEEDSPFAVTGGDE
jgi:signal transduction histidine kinase